MSDIFEEVDQALKQEKILKIWEEYKLTIIGCVIVLILSSALTTMYRSWDSKRDAQETARLINAMESEAPITNITNVIQDTRNNHEALGRMSTAGLLLDEDKKSDAAALYKQVAEDGSSPRDIRDLARILYVQNADTPDIALLKPLLTNEKSPWIWHAKIEAAILAAHTNQDYDAALNYLNGFDDVTTIPLSLKQRGVALAHVYQLKSAENITPASGDTELSGDKK